MPGLTMSEEDRARELAAYVRELQQNEVRLAGMKDDAPGRPDLERTIDMIRDQLRLRGHDGQAPHQRAAKRMRPTEGAETR